MSQKKSRILVKVGTNVLTRKNQRLDYNRIVDLVDQIALVKQEHQVVLVSSGAAGAGREFFDFAEEKDPLIRKQMLASIGQGRLFQVYADFFREQSILPAQALITRNDFYHKASFQNIKTTLEGLLNSGTVPIINENDVVSLQESSFGDNDQLAALTAAMLEVDLMVMLTNIPGFFTQDPTKNQNATLIQRVDKISDELLAYCEDNLSVGGTGGMYSKLKAAELATQNGIPTVVTSGLEPDSLLKAVRGEPTGTFFEPLTSRKKLDPRGNWMNIGAPLKGSLTIDTGAAKALGSNKSLLAVGILKIEGEFDKKDVILIQNQEKIRLGVGLSNFSSQDIKAMLQSASKPQGVIVIHKNHLYTL